MNSNKFLSDYAYLAEASYANFSNNPNSHEKNIKDSEKPINFAKLVINNYEAIAHYRDRGSVVDVTLKGESSFSGTLFKGKKGTENEGNYVLALRGTEQISTDLLMTDAADIVHDGLAHRQIVDMYNFWQQITA